MKIYNCRGGKRTSICRHHCVDATQPEAHISATLATTQHQCLFNKHLCAAQVETIDQQNGADFKG